MLKNARTLTAAQLSGSRGVMETVRCPTSGCCSELTEADGSTSDVATVLASPGTFQKEKKHLIIAWF